jgi:ATP-dependent RNA helicase DDX41
MTPEQLVQVREKYHIVIEGEDVPPPIETFVVGSKSSHCTHFTHSLPQDMKIPPSILQYLRKNKIIKPTPIQIQGIPTA